MKAHRVLAFFAAFITSGTAIAQEAPARFSASIDNFGGRAYSVELRDGALFYSDVAAQESPKPIKVIPTAERWRDFRHALDEIGVWKWHKSYWPSPPIFDGTGWAFSIRYADRSLVTGGGNCYPNADGSSNNVPRSSEAFKRLETAIGALLGGKAFRSAEDEAPQ